MLPKKLLGIDYGMKRIGLALSDERQIFASPLKTFEAAPKMDETALKLLEFIASIEKETRCQIEEIVIGLPLMMSGKKGLIADEVELFAAKLKETSPIPIIIWDERLTTVQAERSLRETDMSRKKRSKVVDIVSAAIILQSYLDHKSLLRDSLSNGPSTDH